MAITFARRISINPETPKSPEQQDTVFFNIILPGPTDQCVETPFGGRRFVQQIVE